jgi:hypothetical protein
MPCLFVRNFASNHRFTITPEVEKGCEWVLAGEGIATAKYDGTACAIFDGKLYARYDAKKGKAPPPGAIPCEPEADPVTGHWPHWVIADRPQDRWIREAWANCPLLNVHATFEAIGPKINGNPHRWREHTLIRHGGHVLVPGDPHRFPPGPPRDFDGLRAWLGDECPFEGVVFHHPDGRMAKIRRDDFGFPWPPAVSP